MIFFFQICQFLVTKVRNLTIFQASTWQKSVKNPLKFKNGKFREFPEIFGKRETHREIPRFPDREFPMRNSRNYQRFLKKKFYPDWLIHVKKLMPTTFELRLWSNLEPFTLFRYKCQTCISKPWDFTNIIKYWYKTINK
jgi:hypothetical protein